MQKAFSSPDCPPLQEDLQILWQGEGQLQSSHLQQPQLPTMHNSPVLHHISGTHSQWYQTTRDAPVKWPKADRENVPWLGSPWLLRQLRPKGRKVKSRFLPCPRSRSLILHTSRQHCASSLTVDAIYLSGMPREICLGFKVVFLWILAKLLLWFYNPPRRAGSKGREHFPISLTEKIPQRAILTVQ